ncbi:MAG: sulfatase-like hydrolase/transferase, partial [Bacteroidales bacterium]|nr:sulfatase-like hydrolase/transferase [Bacteroidales bacterium]
MKNAEKSKFLLSFILLLVIAFNSCSSDKSKETIRQPNILFIPVDDLRPDLGAFGNNYVITPNIDRIAEQGVSFTRT